ncbi:hypothetical protein Leryth_027228 [Lithospermum erythrorhizon]|uniref:Protein phosphatase n=1 Tax=Lithospermum erythrorhizon TaxID=34254 RepID=A0AAV3RBR9_LITER|nr:hypothetical protein Leryth_027228 [Lithospermum erythrorhizon]
MVAKMVRKTPTKSIKNKRTTNRGRKKSPIKNASNAASVVVASVNKSFYSCHRRLAKIFARLARIATPKKTPRKMGYHVVRKFDEDLEVNLVPRALFSHLKPLPPLLANKKNTIVLDLDETLVHSQASPRPERFDFVVKPVIDGEMVEFYVLKRPFLDELLEALSKKFEIVVFTAGVEEYASLVLDKIDGGGLISHKLYRDSCKEVDGRFVKDLSGMGRDLSKVLIVDDNPTCYMFQPENAIPIRPFIDNAGDGELWKLKQFLDGCDEVTDMRDAVKVYLQTEGMEEEVSIEYSKVEL